MKFFSFKALSRMSSFPTGLRAGFGETGWMFQSAVAHELISNRWRRTRTWRLQWSVSKRCRA